MQEFKKEIQLAWQTLDIVMLQIPNYKIVKTDPQPEPHGNPKYVKARILPKIRQPLEFWNATWCFYELFIGPNPRHGSTTFLGGIQFFMAPNNKKCGDGKWWSEIRKIFDELELKSKNEGNGFEIEYCSYAEFQKFYSVSSHPKGFPVFQASDDMLWLIKNMEIHLKPL